MTAVTAPEVTVTEQTPPEPSPLIAMPVCVPSVPPEPAVLI